MINIAFRKLTRAAIFLLPTLGVTWIFGVLAVNSEHVAFAWIFTILNSIEVHTDQKHRTYCQGHIIIYFQ